MATGTPVPTRITVRPDRSFHFDIRTPTTAYMLLMAAGIKERKNKLRGTTQAGHEIIGRVSLKHIYELAKIKQSELRLSGMSLEALSKCIIATAKTVGIEVVP
jgi:large subunit ribosomal protein L11